MNNESEIIKLKCRKTPWITSSLHFTKGKIYDCIKASEDYYYVTDDNGKEEVFFNIDVIFDRV